MRALMLEIKKTRRRFLALPVAAMALLQGLWLAWAVRGLDAGELSQGYLNSLYNFSLINAIMMPVLIAVLQSKLCDAEHKGHMLKLLRTMQGAGALYSAKFALSGLYLVLMVGLQLAAILLVGRVMGFSGPVPLERFASFALGNLLVSLTLSALLLYLALRYVNQFVPLIAGAALAFLGLFSMFFPPWVMRLVPPAYFGLVSDIRLAWDPVTRVSNYYLAPFPLGDCALIAAIGLTAYLLGWRWFVRSEC